MKLAVTAIEKAEYLSDEWFELLAEIDAYVYSEIH